ncbi:MAG: BLUF domain-containing protein [Gallionellaceae bacterium]|jgi:hypothetical protein
MSKLVQMVYISRAAFPATSDGGEIVPEVSKILRKSRINNRAKNIVGALYFGNGFFFQCLEGDEEDLLALYETLKKDPRHNDLRTISMKPINARSFGEWEMKYLPAEAEVQKLLRSFGMTVFDPYRFDEAMTAKMLSMLASGPDLQLQEYALQNDRVACMTWKLSTAVLAILLLADLAWRVLN